MNDYGLFVICFIVISAFSLPVGGQIPGPDAPEGKGSPLRHDAYVNHLSGGYNSHAAAADFDGDGDLDIAVHSALGGGARNTFWGIHIYENIHRKDDVDINPRFAPPRKILSLDRSVFAYDWDGDKSPDLIAGKKWYRNCGHFQFADGKPIPHFPDNVNLIFDWNGDSVPDLLAAETLPGDFWPSAAVWRNGESPYTRDGIWKGGLLRGTLRYYQGARERNGLRWKDCGVLKAGDLPLEVYGGAYPAAADWDHDGDLDLVVGGHFDLTYYENAGSKKKPILSNPRNVLIGLNNDILRGIYIRPVVYPLDDDAYPDLTIAQESGEITFLHCAGLSYSKTPHFSNEIVAFQIEAFLDAGCLSNISVADWDRDGDLDIVSGNSYGEVMLFLNQESKRRWEYCPLKYLRVQAGANGSIQGPNEAHFGYTSPVFCDWNRDGMMDLIVSDIWGRYTYCQRNEVRRSYGNQLLPGVPILCKSGAKETFVPRWVWKRPQNDELITQWRCQPAVEDWNRDGILDLITLDSEGYLALYPGKQISPPEVDAPERAFLLPGGKPIRITPGLNGRSGRARFVVADWDGDGDRDIIRGCTHAGDHEEPNFADYERVAAWYENSGDDRVFTFRGGVMKNDKDVSFCGHETSPAVVDWDGDGRLDLLLGAEDGLIYFFQRDCLDGKR